MTTGKKDMVANHPPLGEVWKMLEERGWLAERSADVRARLLGIAEVRGYRPGESLYMVGEPPRGVYGVARGSVDLSIPRDDGEEIVVHRTQPGFWVGDLALLSSRPRLISVTAATNVITAFLPRTALTGLLERYPELIRDFYVLSQRNMATALQLIANLSVPRADERIALRLLIYDQRRTQNREWLPLSQEKLAQLTALSLPTVQRTLRRLEELGIVELGYGRLRIRDREKLLGYCR